MRFRKPFTRSLFFIFLLTCLLTGLLGTVGVPAQAAPQMLAASHVVISQVYGGGGNTGATDLHIHGIYRDPTNDYGAKYTGITITS